MKGIEFEVVWFDLDVIEYRVTCSNGSFSGATKMYTAPNDLAETADTLSGFPSRVEDSRIIKLGAFEPENAGGGIEMAFRCLDSAGHGLVVASLRDDGCEAMGEPQSVCLCIPIEAGAIDSFVAKARSLGETVGAKAHLRMSDHTVGWAQRRFPNLAIATTRKSS
jgi:hypothetical protein